MQDTDAGGNGKVGGLFQLNARAGSLEANQAEVALSVMQP